MKVVKMMMSVVSGFLPLMFVSAAFAEETETPLSWYLTQNCGNDTFGPSTSMEYWAEGSINGAKGETTDSLNGKDYYYVIDKTFTSKSGKGYVFPGASLTLGDDTSSGNMIIRGSAATFTNLVLKSGYITHASVKSVSDDIKRYDNILGTTTVKSSKTDPFVIKSICSKLWMTWQGKITGDENAGLSIGTADSRNRFLISITNAAAYSGDIVVKSALTNSGRSFGSGLGVQGSIPGTIRLASGTIIKTHDHNASAELGELHMDEGSQMRFVYDSTKMTGGTIRVTRALTLPEKVIVHAMNGAADDAWTPPTSLPEEVRHPFLVGPPGKRIDPNVFEFVPDPAYEPENNSDFNPLPQRLHFEVETDSVSDRDTVYAVLEPFITSKKNQPYNTYSQEDAMASGSALTNGIYWSDERAPHVNAHYIVNNFIFSLADDNREYVFPGKSLIINDGQLYVFGADARLSISNLYVKNYIKQWKSGGVTICGGRVHLLGNDAKMHATLSKTLTVESEIVGSGDLTLRGWGNNNNANTHGFFAFTGFNTNWFGRIRVLTPGNSRYDDWERDYLTIRLYDGRNLGGKLEEFDYRALDLDILCDLYAHTNVTLDAAMNRGIFLSHEKGARISVTNGCTLNCNWPITLNGPLYKTEAGTLALGGGVKFFEVVDNVTNITDTLPEDPIKRLLVVTNGIVKALTHDCVNGLTIALAENSATASLAVDFTEEESDLRKYGFYNVKTDTPFETGKMINIYLNNADGDRLRELKEFKQGLITVKTTAADELELDSLIKIRKGAVSGNSLLRLVREDDSNTGLTTYSAYYKYVGTQIIVR